MSVLDLAAYKPVPATLGDANQIANGFQAIQTCINALDNNNFAAGKIFDLTKLMQGAAALNSVLRWDGANWSKTSTVLVDDANSAVQIGAAGPVSTPVLSVLGLGRQNQLEWGNVANGTLRNTLGNDAAAGTGFLAFYGEHGTNAATYRSRGFRSSIIEPDGTGGFRFGTVALANADNQAISTLATLNNAGGFAASTISNTGTGFFDTAQAGVGAGSLRLSVAGDAQYRFTLANSGAMAWGTGALAVDVSLARQGVSGLGIFGNGAATASLTIDPNSGTQAAAIQMAARNAGVQKLASITVDVGGNFVFNPPAGATNFFQVNGATVATIDTTGIVASGVGVVRGDLRTTAASVTTARAGGAAAALPAAPVRYLAMFDENGNRVYVPAYS